MRKVAVLASVFLFVTMALAEGKISSSWSCAQPAKEHKLAVADEAEHTFSINQTTCTSTKGTIEGVREKTGADTGFVEVRGTTSMWHGRFVVTMENGDKIFYNYEGSGASDPAQTVGNKWMIDGGTGKFKGMQGTGGCTGKHGADGTATWECTGTYALGN